MIQDIYIEVNGFKLPLSEDDISLNFSIEDIKDISKKKTEFSKTIRLPGTPTTHEFFKYMYDVNVQNLFFNPAISTRNTSIKVGDNILIEGTMQLIDIVNQNDRISYQVQIKGRLFDLIDELDKYKLSKLNVSEYNHNRNKQAIKDSWTNQIYKNGELVQSSIGDGYVYPYIIKELPSGEQGELLYIYNQFPAFFVKTLWDKVFEFANLTYTSEFINSEYFKRLILPYAKDKIELPEQDVNNRTTVVGAGGNHPEYEGAGAPVGTGYGALAGPISMDAQGWETNENFDYTFWLLNEDGEVGDKEFQDPQNQWGPYNGWLCKQNGFYDFTMQIQLFVKYFQDIGIPFRSASSNNGSMEYIYGVRKIKANGQQTWLKQPGEALLITPTVTSEYQTNPWYDVTSETQRTMGANIENVWMEDGDRIVVVFYYNYSNMNWQFQGGSPGNASVKARFVAKESYEGSPSFIEVKTSSNQSYGNEDLDMNSLLPDMTMKDFIASIAQLFNLVIVTDKNVPNNLIIEPRDDYFASKTKVLNWGYEEVDGVKGENKLDRDSEVKLIPMSEVDFKSLLLTYREDKDYFNEVYTDETGKRYGELRIDVPNDFSVKEEKIEVKFAPSPMSDNFIGPRVAPFFAKSDLIGEFKPLSVQQRILFWGGLLTSPNATLDENVTLLSDGEGDSETIATAGYPYAGHWDNAYNPVWDLNFGPVEKLYFDANNFPLQTLYEKFHKNTIRSIVDINAMMLEGYFYLTPKDIANFDYRDIVYLDGQYWRVNAIEDYNPVASDSLTKVTLYKLLDYDQNIGLQNAISVSQYECPNDIALIRVGAGYVYQSVSGQFITEECCRNLGGTYIAGTCHVSGTGGGEGGVGSGLVQVGIGGVQDGNDVLNFRLIDGSVTSTTVERIPLEQRANQNGINSPMNLVKGSQNNIATNVKSVGVFGSGNAVGEGVQNALVVGDGVSATESNSIFLKNATIDQFGNILSTGKKIIDGGKDCVFPNTKTNNIDVIDGGKDAVRNIGGASKKRVIIDGSIPTVNANDSEI